jgi:hypothetical protein
MHHCTVEHLRHHAIVAQRLVRGLRTTDQIYENRTLLKFQKDRAERRKTNPTSANPVKMVSGPVMILIVPHRHFGLDVLTNKRPKMRSDEMKRKLATGTMKLEKSANNNTKSMVSPYEPRLTTKPTFVNTKKRKRHLYLNNARTKTLPMTIKMKKHFNFIENNKGDEKKHTHTRTHAHTHTHALFLFFLCHMSSPHMSSGHRVVGHHL